MRDGIECEIMDVWERNVLNRPLDLSKMVWFFVPHFIYKVDACAQRMSLFSGTDLRATCLASERSTAVGLSVGATCPR